MTHSDLEALYGTLLEAAYGSLLVEDTGSGSGAVSAGDVANLEAAYGSLLVEDTLPTSLGPGSGGDDAADDDEACADYSPTSPASTRAVVISDDEEGDGDGGMPPLLSDDVEGADDGGDSIADDGGDAIAGGDSLEAEFGSLIESVEVCGDDVAALESRFGSLFADGPADKSEDNILASRDEEA